ncbi:MipA/OmpV family protein [Undibacterium fentianense]|uniref:MipA/OmpV family protein n=1 Tax=Undibacterium fentianense TaxID=2828728 RepID=A0A941IBR9_9BURK|nr:MipA/OmpV family protein [Undibacterium fentianense]MBR7799384.1 MipA/OmpV family protein [Undibacterium fentianense]
MRKIYAFFTVALASCSNAYAQSPAQNLMPDGSHDMYVGLGILSRPLYEGAIKNKQTLMPVAQIQWSNGLFLAGMSAGWHLSNQFDVEYGPILTLEPNRTPSGTSNSIHVAYDSQSGLVGPESAGRTQIKSTNKLVGMDDLRTRLLMGGFYNRQLTSNLRFTNTFLAGAGNNKKGLRWTSDLRYHLKDIAPHHQLTFGIGVNLVNDAYAQSYFGVSDSEAGRSINPAYSASGGIKDYHADIFWNWNLSSAWLITSKLNVSRLQEVQASPLIDRKTNYSISTALAYRF